MNVLIITGSRDGTSRTAELKAEILDSDLVIHGGADGVDRMADDIARANGIEVCEVKALWKRFGKDAGKRRNGVLDRLGRDLCSAGNTVRFAAFPGPDSVGTWNAVRLFHVLPPLAGKIYPELKPEVHAVNCACSVCTARRFEGRR